MKNISLLIKPASSVCNMRCRYCFYADEAANREQASAGMMTKQTAETLIRQAFETVEEHGSVGFTFQGGEPTMAGLDYFRYFVETAARMKRSGVKVQYSIQTNALNLDESWAEFFAAHQFLVGVSLDGEKTIHNQLRLDAAGKDTWNRVTKNLSMLQKKGVEVNVLCVVTSQSAKHGAKIYNNLKKLGMRYLQFIPCLDPLEKERGEMPYSLTPEAYGKFLCTTFDEWYRDLERGDYTSIRLFDDYVHLAMGLPASTCATSGTCGSYFVVEGDGALFPCDFYCLDQWKMGMIGERSLEELAKGEIAAQFQKESLVHPAECEECSWRSLCNGGCKRDRYWDETGVHNYFCPAFRQFFAYAGERLRRVAMASRNGYLRSR